MITDWIPKFIRRRLDYRPKDVLTAQEYNAILNLLIEQGDHNSSWLEYIQNVAIPNALANLHHDEIVAAIRTAIEQEITGILTSISDKADDFLSNGAITILNVGQRASGIDALDTFLSSEDLYATYALACALIDTPGSLTYEQVEYLHDETENDVVAYGYYGEEISYRDYEYELQEAHSYMHYIGNENVLVYPNGTNYPNVKGYASTLFRYAVNAFESDIIHPQGYNNLTSAIDNCNLPVIVWDSSKSVADIKSYIDTVATYHNYMILQINTDSADYSQQDFEEVIHYIQENPSISFPQHIDEQMQLIKDTIRNRLNILKYIGTVSGSDDVFLKGYNDDGVFVTDLISLKSLAGGPFIRYDDVVIFTEGVDYTTEDTSNVLGNYSHRLSCEIPDTTFTLDNTMVLGVAIKQNEDYYDMESFESIGIHMSTDDTGFECEIWAKNSSYEGMEFKLWVAKIAEHTTS